MLCSLIVRIHATSFWHMIYDKNSDRLAIFDCHIILEDPSYPKHQDHIRREIHQVLQRCKKR